MVERELITGPFEFEAGGRADSVRVVFHTSEGEPSGKKVVWICHALTANSNPKDWWPAIVGQGRIMDPSRYFIVCVNMLGSAYGSSGPSTDDGSGKPWFFRFPAITIRDMAKAMDLVRESLGISRIDLLIGSSIGGFQALEWACGRPELFEAALFMATAPRISPWLSAWAETQRMALEADPTFRECRDLSGGAAGLRCARAQALISYRCFEGYALTQKEEDPDCLFAKRAGSYQRYQGEKLIRRGFNAYSYYYLCDALDSHNVGRRRGCVEKALGRISARSIVAVIDTDNIFPVIETSVWAGWIPGAGKKLVKSSFGHDGFLLETAQVESLINELI